MRHTIRRCAALLLLLAVIALPAQAANTPTTAGIRMTDRGEDEVALWIESVALNTATTYAVALIQLTFPNTWCVTATPGEGLRLESKPTDEGMLLLLEGSLGEPVAVTLRIDRPQGEGGRLTATPATGEPYLYYYYEYDEGDDGDTLSPIGALPLEGATLELPGATADATAGATGTDTVAEPETEPRPTPPLTLGDARYIGCQEAHRADGSLSVRFLFRAAAGTTPSCAVWIASYSPSVAAPYAVALPVLSVSFADAVSVPGGSYPAGDGYQLILYTYEGLPAGGNIVFCVADGDDLYTVGYRDGEFISEVGCCFPCAGL